LYAKKLRSSFLCFKNFFPCKINILLFRQSSFQTHPHILIAQQETVASAEEAVQPTQCINAAEKLRSVKETGAVEAIT
jgi:hypothetical protein